MKGILLSGGSGSRLYPITKAYSKQLLPVYDKPLIYYPLCTLMLLNIRSILCITSKEEQKNYKKLLGNGEQWGIKIEYAYQTKPRGIADAFIVGKDFIKKSKVALILGDNIFYGSELKSLSNFKFTKGAYVYLYQVHDPKRYGVAEVKNNKIISIEEKPLKPKSSLVVTGLYIYDNNVIKHAENLKPSPRNELEITDLNNVYLNKKNLNYIKLSKGSVWLDAGTPDALLQSAEYVRTIQERHQIQIASPEEIAFENKWITKKQFINLPSFNYNNSYGKYLRSIIEK